MTHPVLFVLRIVKPPDGRGYRSHERASFRPDMYCQDALIGFMGTRRIRYAAFYEDRGDVSTAKVEAEARHPGMLVTVDEFHCVQSSVVA